MNTVLTPGNNFGYTQTDTMMSASGKVNPFFKDATVIETAATSKQALELAGLTWQVSKEKVYSLGKRIPNTWATTRSDNGEVLGLVTDKYQVCQNVEAFDFLDALIDAESVEQVRYETAGSLYGGRKVFILAKLPETVILGDAHIPYLCFSNGHDGKGAIRCALTTIRVVCSNTLQYALKHAKRQWGITHKGNIESKLITARQTLFNADKYMKEYTTVAEKKAIEKVDFDKFVQIMLPEKEKTTVREFENRKYLVDSIKDIFENKDDLQNFRGTAYGLYQACADFYSNGKKLRTTEKTAERMQAEFISSSSFLENAQAAIEAAII